MAALTTLAMVALLGVASSARADGVPLATGDVLAATGSGIVKHFSPSGTLLDSLNTTTGAVNTTGMCFDSSNNLFVTDFGPDISKFDSGGNLVAAQFVSSFPGSAESCTVNASNDMFAGGPRVSNIQEYDPTGALINTFAVATDPSGTSGTDWVDLASDECTLYYTDEGSLVKRFNVCTNTQMPDFASALPAPCYEVRIRPDGSVIVACASEAVLLDSSGNIAQTYPIPGSSQLFAANLDPDGTSFWTGDISNGTVSHVDIATGSILGQFPSSPASQLAGLAIVGEIVVSKPTLTLAPATQTQAVGSTAALTATLGTSSAPTPGAAILFSVSGVNTGSGSGTTDANGQVPFSYTGVNAGTDTVTACYDANGNGVCDAGEQTATATVTWTSAGPPPPNDQAITATGGNPVLATEGAAFSGAVATFTDPDRAATASEYSATIDWGDGSTSAGTITGSGASFTVTGSHTYAEEGSHTIMATITDVDAASNLATASTSAKVADAPLSASGVPTIVGASVNGTVAKFTDADPGGTLSDYTASIQWGDGKTTAGTITAGDFGVHGSHSYGRAGTFHITVTIRDAGGSTTTATSDVKAASSGTARLRGIPAACVLNSFSAAVSGKQIARVRFLLDGSKVTSKTVHRGSRYTAMIPLTAGSHRLTVKVTFTASSHTRARTFRAAVGGCKAPVPKFTG